MRKGETAASQRFARALFESSQSQGHGERVWMELSELRRVIEEAPLFLAFLGNPVIPLEHKTRLLDRVLAGRFSPLMLSFLKLLVDRKAVFLLASIEAALAKLWLNQAGREEVRLETAVTYHGPILKRLEEKLGQALHKSVTVQAVVNPPLAAGWKLKIGDQWIDASLDGRLALLRNYWMEVDVSHVTSFH